MSTITISNNMPGLLLNALGNVIGDTLRAGGDRAGFTLVLPGTLGDIAGIINPKAPGVALYLQNKVGESSEVAIIRIDRSVTWDSSVEWDVGISWKN